MVERSDSRLLSAILWVVAFVAMFAAGGYQRRTGPTYEYKGTVEVGGQAIAYEMPRSEETVRDTRVALPLPGAGATGRILYRHYPTDDAFTPVEMREEKSDEGVTELAGYLPAQPSAGKLEYYVELSTADGPRRIPELGAMKDGSDAIVMRYKDPVPIPLLIAHVLMMFVAMMIGVRAALAALVGEAKMARLAWVTLGGLFVGGLILGPFVQKYAFGALWTGFPFGYDLTDNKTLIMWIVWVVSVSVLAKRPAPRDRLARGTLLLAAVAMMTVYLIPHSLRGSELDYNAVVEAPSSDEGR
jgi:hypothetical protein